MRAWTGIRRDSTALGDASAFYIQNGRFYTEGELRRRRGLAKMAQQAGQSSSLFWHPSAGNLAVFQTSSGTIEFVVPA